MSIKIGILGYGNLGKGVEAAVKQNEDMELVAVFTRRNPQDLTIATPNAKVLSMDDAIEMKDKIDVMILCGGSATDLPEQTPQFAQYFNVVDSFDTHANIPTHFAAVDKMAKVGGKVGIISVGWDPGMFSLNRVYAQAALISGATYTFWGKGVSQGHSDAIRRIAGVVDARQYTVPVEAALEAVRSGSNPEFTTRQKHTRECFVVVEDGADKVSIEKTIQHMPNYFAVVEDGADKVSIEKTIQHMPNYFADYDTTVNFITQEELNRNHVGIPHGGFVIRSGKTGLTEENNNIIEYSLKLDSNPEFTASVITAYARAAYCLNERGGSGCRTVFDIAPADLCIEDGATLRAMLL